MGTPKMKVSKARRNSRKASWKAAAPTIVECPNCGEKIRPHRACKSCGYYKGEKRFELKADKKEESSE